MSAAAAAANSLPPPARSPEAAERRQWYLGREGERRGPYAFTEIVAMAGADGVDAADLVWRPGFRAWTQADSIVGLLSPPPIPPTQPGRAPHPVPADVPAAARTRLPDPAQPRPSSDWEWARAALATLDHSVPAEENADHASEAAPPDEPAQAAVPDAVPVEEEHHPPAAAEPQSAEPQSAEPQSAEPQSAEPQSAEPQSAEPAPPAAADAHDSPNSETERLRSLVGGLATQTVEPRHSYIARHWHGELSFTRSLLVNGVLLTAAIGGAYETIAIAGPDFVALVKPLLARTGLDLGRLSSLWDAAPLWVVASARLAPWFAAAGVYLWSIVGIVRAARNRA